MGHLPNMFVFARLVAMSEAASVVTHHFISNISTFIESLSSFSLCIPHHQAEIAADAFLRKIK